VTEPVALRLLVVAIVTAAVVGWALVARRGIAVRRRPIRVDGLGDGVTLFASATCESCGRMEALLAAVGVEYRRVGYESDRDSFTRYGVERVPTLVVADRSGRGWAAEGVPSPRRLARWLRDP
jgi:hypothetical protein